MRNDPSSCVPRKLQAASPTTITLLETTMNFARGKLMLASFLTLVASGVGFQRAAGGIGNRV